MTFPVEMLSMTSIAQIPGCTLSVPGNNCEVVLCFRKFYLVSSKIAPIFCQETSTLNNENVTKEVLF